jgi:hypothetical protein
MCPESRVRGRNLSRACVAIVAALLGGVVARASAQNLEATLVPADPASTQLFGQSVALQGDLAVVGATGDTSNAGAAYVFRRTLGLWTQELKLEPAELEATDLFGAGTSIDGDLVAVGAPDALDVFGGGSPGSGAIYLFRDEGGTWPQQARVTALDSENFDQLGRSVAVQGDVLVAGAPGDTPTGDGDPQGGEGSAYVFRFDGVAWSQEAKLTSSHAANGDRLGESVAVDGDIIALGAPGYDHFATDTGTVYVFRRIAGQWLFDVRLNAADANAGDNFGAAVALDGNLLAIGAPHDNQGASDTGAVYLFSFDGATWTQQLKLVASDAAANAQLGASVALQAPILLAGSPGASAGDGKGYLFAHYGTEWIEHSQLMDGASLASGRGVALDGAQVLLGAPWTSNGGLLFAGDAYLFEAFTDCNGNSLPDDTDVALGISPDCNANLVPDECDVATGFSLDCDGNGVPDECDTDCNSNQLPDFCDILNGVSEDCDGNGVPDECDPDLNENNIPDACEGTWANLGHALAGSAGDPQLAGTGTLIATQAITLTLTNALPSSSATLIVGLSALNAPFKGGVIVPHPDVLIFGLPTGPAGTLPLTAHWPGGLPHSFTIYFQYWIVDAAGPSGLSASNGLGATTPAF